LDERIGTPKENWNAAGDPVNCLDIRELREAFAAYLPLPPTLEPHLRDALQQILGNAGSLVRSQIVLQMSGAYGVPHSQAKQLAIGLEYFHTASLLFDDLPCMDNAVERRGAPCVHLEFGESGAILAALAIINRAYSLTWQSVYACPPERQTRAIAYVEQHLGIGGLLNGQSLDLHYARLPHDLRTTERVAFGKTVSLIRLTVVLPALLGGAPPSELLLLDRIAKYWGLSYQIVDDLKDVLQSPAEVGKTVSRDASLDRPNIALAVGIPAAVERLERFIRIGDETVRRLVVRRPAVTFLKTLRSNMQEEATRVTRNACETTLQTPA
jgi:geranylgeranyl pyrophosphate synthase